MGKNFKDSIGGGKKDQLITQLIRGTTQKEEEFTLAWLPHEKVYSVDQARKQFINIEGLAASMKGREQIQAITVYPADADGRHQIKTGERRWRAAVLNNEPVLAMILNRQKKVVPEETVDATLIAEQLKVRFQQVKENDQREPLTPMEMAIELGKMRDQFHLKPGQIAEGIGRPAAYVSKHLKLLEMPKPLQDLMEEGIVTYIETLNILTNVFSVSEAAGMELIEEARKNGELTRADAQSFLKNLKAGNATPGNHNNPGSQVPTDKNEQPENTGSPGNKDSGAGNRNNAGNQVLAGNNEQPDTTGSLVNKAPETDNLNNAGDQELTGNNEQPDTTGSLVNKAPETDNLNNAGDQELAGNNEQPDTTGSLVNKAPETDKQNDAGRQLQPGPVQDEQPDHNKQSSETENRVTFYVLVEGEEFELINKPSIRENGEVYIFCREAEGMPEMQVPISDCTLHHASLTK